MAGRRRAIASAVAAQVGRSVRFEVAARRGAGRDAMSYDPRWGLPSGKKTWIAVWIATGVLIAAAIIASYFHSKRERHPDELAVGDPPPGALASEPAQGATGAQATVIATDAWPDLPARLNGWVSRATILEPYGSEWAERGEATGLAGPPDAGAFEVPPAAHQIVALALKFPPTEAPSREVAIIGTSPGAVVVGVVLHTPGGVDDLEWRATTPLSPSGELLRITFPRAVVTRDVTVILRPRGPGSLAGVALVRE